MTEYVPTSAQAEYMVFRACARSPEVAWTAPGERNYQGFPARRLDSHRHHFAALGINYRD
jgi:N-acetyl-beta-hexosaminidase